MTKNIKQQNHNKKQIFDGIKAYIFIQINNGKIAEVLNESRKLKSVVSAAAISGDYDIILKANVSNFDQLIILNENIQLIDGVEHVALHIVEKEIN